MKLRRTFSSVLFLTLSGLSVFGQNAVRDMHWVTTWGAANVQPAAGRPVAVGQPTPTATQAMGGFNNQTVRMIVPVSIGGRRVRVQFSNRYGTTPLVIGAAHVGIHAADSAIVPGSDRALMFGGKPGFTIPPGAVAVSDGVDMDLAPVSELAISVFVPGVTGPPTVHSLGLHSTYVSKPGDMTAQASIADAAVTQSWYWLSSVDVQAPNSTNAIVAFGDSITDGARSTPEINAGWPSVLARRLNAGNANVAVVNEGISGNRLLRDNAGPNALSRFNEDVLSRAGVKWVILLEGINDIGRATGPGSNPADMATTADVIGALQQLTERAHVRGINVIGATVLPYTDAAYFSEKGEAMRQAVNEWIRSSKELNGVIDYDALMRDPKSPGKIRPEFDSGDHLHPNDAGYKAMAESIDLSLFGVKLAPASASAR